MPNWVPGTVAFASALIVSLVATPLVRTLALRWRLGDKPNGRRLNDRPIPHLGGIALFLGIITALIAFFSLTSHSGISSSIVVRSIPVVLLIVALGLIDDTRNLRARHKLIVQLVAAAGMVGLGYRLFTGVWMFDAWMGVLSSLSLVFIVGMLSSINLIDGHDGLAAGASIGAFVDSLPAILVRGAAHVYPRSAMDVVQHGRGRHGYPWTNL
jgi:UDP-GlcNAc:undecaprenyl-phosphate GlcNAc-1-phosphate transferase